MAKRKTKRSAGGAESTRKRRRRSDEELITELKDKIDEIKQRQKARDLKQSPAVKSAISAVKSIDKALDAAAEENQTHLRHALADSRKPLAAYLSSTGLRLPKANLPRGRKPKMHLEL